MGEYEFCNMDVNNTPKNRHKNILDIVEDSSYLCKKAQSQWQLRGSSRLWVHALN